MNKFIFTLMMFVVFGCSKPIEERIIVVCSFDQKEEIVKFYKECLIKQSWGCEQKVRILFPDQCNILFKDGTIPLLFSN